MAAPGAAASSTPCGEHPRPRLPTPRASWSRSGVGCARRPRSRPTPGRTRTGSWSKLPGGRAPGAGRNSRADAHRELVEAACATPEPRAPYPFTGHRALRFSVATRPLPDAVGPGPWCTEDGGFRVALLVARPGLRPCAGGGRGGGAPAAGGVRTGAVRGRARGAGNEVEPAEEG
ncbi:DUF6193 family natural product biosynthesis protein [Streptomyces omiyaensis]|uniref:DUF6193 family natural product biosynthesis protein n=1 Tax=Streptomyces omiyaensis TaxID=68247 RepID=UPI003702C46A